MSGPHSERLLDPLLSDQDDNFSRRSTDTSSTSSIASALPRRLDTLQRRTSSTTNLETNGSLTFLNGIAIVVGLQIGVGIFSIPSFVSAHVPSPGAGVLVWFLGGLLVWTGAASLIELGAAIPRNGGIQEYLRYCYGDFAGFIFSWIWISIGRPCSMSIIALIFAEHVNGVVLPDSWAGGWLDKVTAMMGVWMITLVNCLGTHTGAYVAVGFLVLKITTVLSIILTGMIIGLRGEGGGVAKSHLGWFGTDGSPLIKRRDGGANAWALIGDYITALFAALWGYAGWETIGFVAGELRNPKRDISRVINGAMIIVVSGFALINIAMYVVLPMEVIREKDMVAVTFARTVFGPTGGLIYTLIISLSALGSLNSSIFLTGRIVVAASRRNYFPRILGGDSGVTSRENETRYIRQRTRSWPAWVGDACVWVSELTSELRWEKQVPIYAMMMNATLASCYIVVGTFSAFLTFVGIAQYVIFFFTVLGVFRLRARLGSSLSGDEKSYRTSSFNPVVFCLVSAFLVVRGVVTDPGQGLVVCICIGCGWAVYWYKTRGMINGGNS